VPDANLPTRGKKRTSRKEQQKRGGYKSRANAAPAPRGGKYPKKFNSVEVDG